MINKVQQIYIKNWISRFWKYCFGVNQGHHSIFGYFSTNAYTSYTSGMKLNAATGGVGIQNTNPQSMLYLENCEVITWQPLELFLVRKVNILKILETWTDK